MDGIRVQLGVQRRSKGLTQVGAELQELKR